MIQLTKSELHRANRIHRAFMTVQKDLTEQAKQLTNCDKMRVEVDLDDCVKLRVFKHRDCMTTIVSSQTSVVDGKLSVMRRELEAELATE